MKTYKYILLISFFASLTACKKFVDVDVPRTRLVTESVFQSDETATSALMGVYSSMVSREQLPFILPWLTGIEGDELRPYETNAEIQLAYVNNLNPIDAITNTIWNSGYNYIFQANSLIEGCTASKKMSKAVKKQILAEGYFLRAFWNFYLVNLYGDIPLLTTTSLSENSTGIRVSKELVYQQIISDLKFAQANLNDNYVANNSITASTERIRPNKAAATAFLSRTYLYHKDYIDAEREATTVINKKSMYDTVGTSGVFLKNNIEAIWQLIMPTPTNNRNTWEGNYFILTGKPIPGNVNSNALHQQFYNAFETGDRRKTSWIGQVTDVSITPNITYYYPFKYQVSISAATTEYSTVIRLAELYLIRAEARIQLENLSGGIDDIDVIRKRARLPLIRTTNPTILKDDLLTAILKERRFELFTEWGHRWLDLKRTGKIDGVMNAFKTTKASTWESNKELWPIPQADRNNNINLGQNPGYIQ